MKVIFGILFSILISLNLSAQSITDSSVSNSERDVVDERGRFSLAHLTDKTISPWCIPGKDWSKSDNIELVLDKKSTISQIYIANGFFDSKYFSLNSRPSKILLKSNSGEKREIELKDNYNLETYSFPPMSGNVITLYFSEIKKGSKYNDICLSEISFLPVENKDLINNRKKLNEKVANIIKKPMIFKSVHGEENDYFTIKPNGNNFNIEPFSKSQKSIILYQPYGVFSLIVSPSPKITLLPIINSYDLLMIKLEGKCNSNFDGENKIESCKVFFNPEDASYSVYMKNKLSFQSKYPEDIQ